MQEVGYKPGKYFRKKKLDFKCAFYGSFWEKWRNCLSPKLQTDNVWAYRLSRVIKTNFPTQGTCLADPKISNLITISNRMRIHRWVNETLLFLSWFMPTLFVYYYLGKRYRGTKLPHFIWRKDIHWLYFLMHF